MTLELIAYESESWFSEYGARLKARRLQRAGIPDLTNWKFITLTVANRQIRPEAAYARGKSQIRRFLARFRKSVGVAFKWCWKLEFHEDGYAHWHLLVQYTRRIPKEVLPVLETWWGLGRVNVKRVNRRDMAYLFKYVAKGLEDLPGWVVAHKGRFRVFQASTGFFTHRESRKADKREPASCLVKVDLQTRKSWDEKKALLVSEDRHGNRRIRAVKLRMRFSALLVARAGEALRRGVPLAAPNTVAISQHQADTIKHEHSKYAGLAGIPANSHLS